MIEAHIMYSFCIFPCTRWDIGVSSSSMKASYAQVFVLRGVDSGNKHGSGLSLGNHDWHSAYKQAAVG